jgi:hypothetical protein
LTKEGKSQKGKADKDPHANEPCIGFKEMVMGLSVMTRGNAEEKLNCMECADVECIWFTT